MQGRNFIISLSGNSFKQRKILNITKEVFLNLGYKALFDDLDDEKMIFEKGSKFATYLGLVNWDIVYRRVEVKIERNDGKIVMSYFFSWLTNIGFLIRAAMSEIAYLKKELGAESLKVEKFR